MTESEALVVAVDGQTAWLEANTRSSCSGCSANQSCGTSVLSQVLGKRISRIAVRNTIGVAPGDQVVVAMDDAAIRRGTWMLYGLPLLLLIAGSALFSWLGNGSELAQILGALSGLLAGLVFASSRLSPRVSSRSPGPCSAENGPSQFQPRLVRRLAGAGHTGFDSISVPRTLGFGSHSGDPNAS